MSDLRGLREANVSEGGYEVICGDGKAYAIKIVYSLFATNFSVFIDCGVKFER
jgi:hypothetical protein